MRERTGSKQNVFLDKALKMFPEDGYFLKYKADIFWMDGEMQKAAELLSSGKE